MELNKYPAKMQTETILPKFFELEKISHIDLFADYNFFAYRIITVDTIINIFISWLIDYFILYPALFLKNNC